MNAKKERELFDTSFKGIEKAMLTFYGTEGYDVYNCSIPFTYNNKRYIYGRVERREEWIRSWVRLFEETSKDTYELVPDSMIYQLEDPYIAIIHNQLVLGGTHVKTVQNNHTYCGYFYKGTDLFNLYYFTTGPEYMKDIRLVELADKRIGVFSRPRNNEILNTYGSESMIGFTILDSLDELTPEIIEKAPYIDDLFKEGEWGGCNQVYLLDSGLLGVIGHLSYHDEGLASYLNISFIFDAEKRIVYNQHVIGTRKSFPEGPAKTPELTDCAFTSGIVMREDGYADLYSGIGDCKEGRTVIKYPFEGYGRIVSKDLGIV